jgi:hypothetical protein
MSYGAANGNNFSLIFGACTMHNMAAMREIGAKYFWPSTLFVNYAPKKINISSRKRI